MHGRTLGWNHSYGGSHGKQDRLAVSCKLSRRLCDQWANRNYLANWLMGSIVLLVRSGSLSPAWFLKCCLWS